MADAPSGPSITTGLDFLAKQIYDSGHRHANPDGKGVERAGIGIVTLTRLLRSLVEVKHNGETRHKEEEENNAG